LYDLYFINFDAVLGRLLQVDPMAVARHDECMYTYAGNSPVVLNEPMGNLPVSQEMLSAQMKYFNDVAKINANHWDSWHVNFYDPIHPSKGGGGSGGYYSNVGPSYENIKQRDIYRALGYDASFDARGNLQYWCATCGDEVDRATWLEAGGDGTKWASQYFPGMWINVGGHPLEDPNHVKLMEFINFYFNDRRPADVNFTWVVKIDYEFRWTSDGDGTRRRLLSSDQHDEWDRGECCGYGYFGK
jgi:hypothetical protein